MKKINILFFPVLYCLALAGCQALIMDPEEELIPSSDELLTKSDSADEYYQESTGLVLTPSSFSQYTKTNASDPSVTHLSVKFLPKSAEQQRAVNLLADKGCYVSYVPFGYSIVRNAGPADKTMLPKIQERKYVRRSNPAVDKVIIDREEGCESCCEDANRVTETYFYEMYAICPVGVAFPAGVEYEVCDGLRGPGNGGGIIIPPDPTFYYLVFSTYDTLLNTYVPLRNLKVRIQLGDAYAERYTNAQGVVDVTSSYILGINYNQATQASVTCIMESPHWVISRNNSTTPVHTNLGTIQSLWAAHPFLFGSDTLSRHMTSLSTEYEIHRAVDYYFYDNHDLQNYIISTESGTILQAMDDPDPTALGRTWPGDAKIAIYNSGNPHRKTISTVFHELGHMHHYRYGPQIFSQTANNIIESYASFIGFLLGESYYLDKGFTKPYYGYQINQQGRQQWWLGITSSLLDYTPFFVDLIDDYNQHNDLTLYDHLSYVDDNISDVPISIHEDMIQECTSLSECYSFLEDYIGTYFTASDLSLMYSYYE